MFGQLNLTLQRFADSLRHANRRDVLRIDETDQAIATHLVERELHAPLRGFARVALAPPVAAHRPAELEVRPAVGLMKPDPANERTGAFLEHAPHAEAAQVPVSDDHG